MHHHSFSTGEVDDAPLNDNKDMNEESDLMDLYLSNILTEELLRKGYFLTNN